MNTKLLEDILSCPSLPSLPAVAMRVIELTGDQNVSLDELASTIQNDQALAAKVLRTVNSSFYGLRERCGTIRKAIAMLGLGPVKSLTLGFSLVSTFEQCADPSFDFEGYWRRGLFTAVAAQRFAVEARLDEPDEVFLAGLLQDVGIMAIYQVLGAEYASMIAEAKGDHRVLGRLEVERLELTHADIGSMLCKRWRLPDALVLPVKFHERPTAAPVSARDVTRCLGLGNMVHDIMTLEDSGESLKLLYRRTEEWFQIPSDRVRELTSEITEDTRKMASLFQLSIGASADPERVLAEASERMVELSRTEGSAPGGTPEGIAALLLEGDKTDALTGALNLKGLEEALVAGWKGCQSGGEPLTVLVTGVDGYPRLVETTGEMDRDTIALGVTTQLRKHFEPFGGVVARLDASRFAVVMAGTQRQPAVRAANDFRHDIEVASARWSGKMPDGGVRVSVGVVTAESGGPIRSHRDLITSALKGLAASQAAGGNCIRAFVPKEAA